MINKPMPKLPFRATKGQMLNHIMELEHQLVELRRYFEKPKSTGAGVIYTSDSPYVPPEFQRKS